MAYHVPMFEWDAYNEREVAAHSVEPDEAEEAFEDERLLARRAYEKDGERRQAIIASTRAGRLLGVVYTWRGAAIRVITAYPVSGRLHRRYLEDH
jgi:uncharacterized DUF497 family protein